MLAARAWVLVDATSGARLASFEPLARLEPASLTKLMTAYVVFTALNENRIALTDAVTVQVAPETAVRVPRGEIRGIEPLAVSMMPPGLEQMLSGSELADLVAFLESLPDPIDRPSRQRQP